MGSALATGYLAAHYGLRPQPFYLGVVYVVLGLLLSLLLVKETRGHAQHESELHGGQKPPAASQTRIFLETSFRDRDLSSVTQAGFVNNLNDGMAWGLFPIFFAAAGMSLQQIGWLAAIYPGTWGILQLWTGHLSDRLGRKWMIAWGMWVQAVGIGLTILATSFPWFAVGAVLLGTGTAMVYPTLLAAIGDVVHPRTRATSVGVYRLWRDMGYADRQSDLRTAANRSSRSACSWMSRKLGLKRKQSHTGCDWRARSQRLVSRAAVAAPGRRHQHELGLAVTPAEYAVRRRTTIFDMCGVHPRWRRLQVRRDKNETARMSWQWRQPPMSCGINPKPLPAGN